MAIIVIIVIIVLIYIFVIKGQNNNKRRSLVIDGLDVIKHIGARAPVADDAGDALNNLALQRLHLPQLPRH